MTVILDAKFETACLAYFVIKRDVMKEVAFCSQPSFVCCQHLKISCCASDSSVLLDVLHRHIDRPQAVMILKFIRPLVLADFRTVSHVDLIGRLSIGKMQ